MKTRIKKEKRILNIFPLLLNLYHDFQDNHFKLSLKSRNIFFLENKDKEFLKPSVVLRLIEAPKIIKNNYS